MEESYLLKFCWYQWLGGLMSAIISSAAGGIVMCIVDPSTFNLEAGLPILLKTAAVFGIIGGANYLKDYPGPKEKLTT